MKVAEDLPKMYENTTNYDNYTFINMRDRDEHRKVLMAMKEIEDARLEKLSSEKNYTKKRKPVHDQQICYKSDIPDADGDGDEDNPDHGCAAKFNETINLKAKEASVFLPLDVFDKGDNSEFLS